MLQFVCIICRNICTAVASAPDRAGILPSPNGVAQTPKKYVWRASGQKILEKIRRAKEALAAPDVIITQLRDSTLGAFLQPTEDGPRICKQQVERIPRLDRSTVRFVRPRFESWVQ
jgi:hypothetical protein